MSTEEAKKSAATTPSIPAEAHAPQAAPPSAVKPKKKGGVLLGHLKILFSAPISSDFKTRMYGIFFYTSLMGILFVFGFFFIYLGNNKKHHPTEEEISAQLKEEKRLQDEKKVHTFAVGEFRVPYSEKLTVQGKIIPLPLAQVEIVLQCNNEEACLYVKNNVVRFKDLIASSFVHLSREELMKPEGKQKLKSALIEKLNERLLEKAVDGKVIDIFFQKFVLG